MICVHILKKQDASSILNIATPRPTDGKYSNIEGYWVQEGDKKPFINESYVLTRSVRRNLKDLSRLVSTW